MTDHCDTSAAPKRIKARVRNFEWAGIVVSFDDPGPGESWDDAFEALDAILALPSMAGFRSSGWVGVTPSSVYLSPRNAIQNDGPERKRRKAEIKTLLRARGFLVVAESLPIGRQVR